MSSIARVCAGAIDYRPTTWDDADRLVSRIVSQGRITRRATDGCYDKHTRVNLAIVEHPICEPGEVVALYWMGGANPTNAYICTEADALDALRHPSAFNL